MNLIFFAEIININHKIIINIQLGAEVGIGNNINIIQIISKIIKIIILKNNGILYLLILLKILCSNLLFLVNYLFNLFRYFLAFLHSNNITDFSLISFKFKIIFSFLNHHSIKPSKKLFL